MMDNIKRTLRMLLKGVKILEIVKFNFGVNNIRYIGFKDYLKYSTTGFKPPI
jgi:hypothetical protein